MKTPQISRPQAVEQHASELDGDHDLDSMSQSKCKSAAPNDGNRLAQLQAMVNSSPQVRAMASLQAAVNGRQEMKSAQSESNAHSPERQEQSSGAESAASDSSPDGKLPAALQAGIVELSGLDLSDVNVHYNSAKPAQLQAKAFAQGNEIHLAAGEEQHLPHEAWHLVQQRQGRVQPTHKMAGTAINSDPKLEREADEMGPKAARTTTKRQPRSPKHSPTSGNAPVQRMITWNGKQWNFQDAFMQIVELNIFPSSQLSVLYNYVLPAYDAQNRSFDSLDQLIEILKKVLPVMLRMSRQASSSSMKVLIKEQLEIQQIILKDEGLFRGLFTTCGFEHEFLGFESSVLSGLDHVELGETTENFLYRELPFLLETDGGNIIELVSPPFLIPVIMGQVIPCPLVTGEIDKLFVDTLKEGIKFATKKTANLGQFLEWLNDVTGMKFKLHEKIIFDEGMLASNVDCELLCKNLQYEDDGQFSFSDQQLSNINVGANKKNRVKDEPVSSQLNFATNMDIAGKFTEMNGADNEFTKKLKPIEAMLIEFLELDRLSNNSGMFGLYMARNFAGLYAVYSQKMVGKLQAQQMEIIKKEMQKRQFEKKDSSQKTDPIPNILKATTGNHFYNHERMMSFVKDVSNGWIKDHLVNIAISMMNLQECEELSFYLLDKQKKIRTLTEPESDSMFKHDKLPEHWKDFMNLLDGTMLKFIIDLSTRVSIMKSKNKNLDEICMDETDEDQHLVQEYVGKHPKLKFYQHDDTFAGARQGTYIPSKKVQMPKVWDKNLHVVEVRRGKPQDTLKKLKRSVLRDQSQNKNQEVNSEKKQESKVKINGCLYDVNGVNFNVAHEGIRSQGQCAWDTFRHYGINDDMLAEAAKAAGLKIDDWLDDQDLDKLVAELNNLGADICIDLTIFSYENNLFFNRKIGKGSQTLIFGLAVHWGDSNATGLGHFVPGKK